MDPAACAEVPAGSGVIVLAVLAVPVCAIAAFAMVLRVRGRVQLIEARLAAAEGALRAAALHRPRQPKPLRGSPGTRERT